LTPHKHNRSSTRSRSPSANAQHNRSSPPQAASNSIRESPHSPPRAQSSLPAATTHPAKATAYANTLLRATAAQFLAAPHDLQREIFGNATLAVTVETQQELQSILRLLEGNLTGTIYSAKSGADDETYNTIAPLLREKVGRLLNDKMPTGVAVSPAMNHGGPYPATSHPGSTSVGIPTSIARFAKLDCYDAVRPERLPAILKDTITNPNTWRSINGAWVKG